MHLIALHDTAGSSNPLGSSGNFDRVTFSPYFLWFSKFIFIFLIFFILSHHIQLINYFLEHFITQIVCLISHYCVLSCVEQLQSYAWAAAPVIRCKKFYSYITPNNASPQLPSLIVDNEQLELPECYLA